MKTKSIILTIVGTILIGVVVYFLIPSDNEKVDTAEQQLYTCGMHPDIISEEPGNCPICEMKLTPMRSNKSSGERTILHWRAPMDPNEIYDQPGKSKMGMDLVPVYSDGMGAEGTVMIDPVVQQNMNVKTEQVQRKSLAAKVTTNGVLSVDETREYYVTTRVDGWVEKLYVNFTGQKVIKGDKLMDIYSPELVAAQQEYLAAVSYQQSVNKSSIGEVSKGGDEMVNNAFRKLQLLEMSESDIHNLRRAKELKTFITLYAQKSGTVLMKQVVEGEKIKAGAQLLHIADLSRLWLTADIYEYELSKIKVGANTEMKYNFLPGKTFHGKVSFIYPTIDAKSRTAKIRINVSNTTGDLKPEMFASVEVKGEESGEVLVVFESSVIRSGEMDVVILSLGDGKFKPQMVKLGDYSDGYYEIIKGVTDGDVIVTSAQFLIDSESNLKAAVNQFQSGNDQASFEMEEDMNSEMPDAAAIEEQISHEGHAHTMMETESIIREGVIDVESIDKNGDGRVFECHMDWNVIADESGRCPTCEMRLKEYTLDETKANLTKYGYESKR
ncbi:efflux RND transporter periplasmic adaptor subunit [Bacteroidota bacterium]